MIFALYNLFRASNNNKTKRFPLFVQFMTIWSQTFSFMWVFFPTPDYMTSGYDCCIFNHKHWNWTGKKKLLSISFWDFVHVKNMHNISNMFFFLRFPSLDSTNDRRPGKGCAQRNNTVWSHTRMCRVKVINQHNP